MKLTFQQSERQPRAAGPSALLYLTARCRSARVEQCFRVISHLDLKGCTSEWVPTDSKGGQGGLTELR